MSRCELCRSHPVAAAVQLARVAISLVTASVSEAVVPASKLAAARAAIAKPQHVLGQKTLENEILELPRVF